MNDESIMIWEVVVVFGLYGVRTKRKRYFAKPDGADIGKFLSMSLSTQPIISVKVNQYQADLTPIEMKEES